MRQIPNFSKFVKSPFTWAVTSGLVFGLFAASYLSGQIRFKLTEETLRHMERRAASLSLLSPLKRPPINTRKLASLQLWGKPGVNGATMAGSAEGKPLALPKGGSLTLKGIVRYPDGVFEAVFTDQTGKKTIVAREGDRIGPLQIATIKPDQVVVSRDGRQSAYFLFHKKSGQKGKTSAVGGTPPLPGAPRGNRATLNKQEVQTALSDMASFLRQVRIVPYINQGKPQGFQLLDIVPGSIVDRVGLKNGDVVSRVNGKPIRTPQEAMQLFSLLQAGRGLTIEILRNHRPKSITIELK